MPTLAKPRVFLPFGLKPTAFVAALIAVVLLVGGLSLAFGQVSLPGSLFQTTAESVQKAQANDEGHSPVNQSDGREGALSSTKGTGIEADAKGTPGENETAGSGAGQGDVTPSGDVQGTTGGSTPGVPGAGASSSGEGSAVSGSTTSTGQGDAPPPVSEPPTQPATITVSVYVDSSLASGYPACLAQASVTLSPGASVYDALCATGVSVGGSSSYVRSIGGLAEFGGGPNGGFLPGSGWLYYVNGSSPGYSCGSYLLYGGESIVWKFTLE